MLRVGLVGAGKHGRRYARHIVEDFPELRLVAVCRRNEAEGEAFARAFGAAYFCDYRALLEKADIDAVVVVVPPSLHGAIVSFACAAGKHVLVEKPLAVSVAEARRLRDLVTASNVRCMVAHTLRFNSVVQALKAHAGDVGPLQSLYLSQRFEPSALGWLDRPSEGGGGIVLQTGVHSFDLVRFFSGGEMRRVWCRTGRAVTMATEDWFTMTAQLTGGVEAAVMGSRATQSRNGLIELTGADGQLVGDHVHGFAYLVRGLTKTALPVAPPVPTVRETLGAFAAALAGSAPFPIGLDDGLHAVAVAEACYRSAASGHAVDVTT